MDYELYLVSKPDVDLLKDELVALLEEAGLNVQSHKYETPNLTYFHLGCTLFDINIEIAGEDFEEDKAEDIELCRKYYGVEINKRLGLFLYSKTFYLEGWTKLLRFTGRILDQMEGDLLLVDDTSFPVLKRIQGQLLVNSRLDKYNIKYITEENLKNLDYPYSFRNF